MYVYLMVSADSFELPYGVFDSLREISDTYGIAYRTVRIASCKHRVLRRLNARIVKVWLE